MTNPYETRAASAGDEAIVSLAVINAARKLEITDPELSGIIGVPEAQLALVAHGSPLRKESKEFELSLLFVRMFRSLDALVGGDGGSATHWMRNRNLAFGQIPIERIRTKEGLLDVISYLDSRRAPI